MRALHEQIFNCLKFCRQQLPTSSAASWSRMKSWNWVGPTDYGAGRTRQSGAQHQCCVSSFFMLSFFILSFISLFAIVTEVT